MRRTPPADSVAWQEEGRRAAGALKDVAAAVVLGRNAEQAADVAVGIALALCNHRQVVLADLVGELDPLYELAGGDDALGLTDCLRDELPLNDIARRAMAHATIFVLPAGTPPVATLRTLGHERWPKLVRGFAEAGALLLLVAQLDGDGIDTLVSATQGIVAVDTPPQLIRRFPLVATVDAPAGGGGFDPADAASGREAAAAGPRCPAERGNWHGCPVLVAVGAAPHGGAQRLQRSRWASARHAGHRSGVGPRGDGHPNRRRHHPARRSRERR